MLKEIRKLEKKDKKKARNIRSLQNRQNIGKFISKNGYVMYDTEELKEYKANSKIGRPVKREKI